MSENNKEFSESQPTPEIFSDATSRFLNNNPSPQKVYSASQPEPANSGILKKGRKSLGGNGRRVSFAATAHVRVFGSEEKSAAEEAKRRKEMEEEAEEERRLAEFRKQFENSNEAEDEQKSSVEAINNSLNEFEIKSSPLSSAAPKETSEVSLTPLKRSFTSIDQSFDVDLKVEEQPSFSSYLSPEKDMDLTGCVGNILDDLSSPMSAHTRRQSQMEFTNCVGSILAQIESESAHSGEDMEMTQSVGSLIVDSVDSGKMMSAENNENVQDNMEMTQPIGSLIVEASTSSKNELVEASTSSKNELVEVSFIQDCDQPANFVNEESTIIEPSETVNSVKPVDSISPFEIAESVNIDNQMDISEVVDRESVQIAKEAVEAVKTEMFQVFSIPSAGSKIQEGISTVSASSVANLKEFLNETGVRFLDNLSNMGRRETVGKPRDSTIITPARRMYVRSVLVPETLAVEKACSECVRTIEAQRLFLFEEEGKFNHHPPLAYREFLKYPTESTERNLLLQKLKTLKSVARLFARQSWYEWRRGFETNFRAELEKVLTNLKIEYGALETERVKLTSVNGEQVEPKLEALQAQLTLLKSRYDSLSRSDWEAASQLHEVVMNEREKAKATDRELEETLARESDLRASIESVLEQRRLAHERLTSLKHAAAQFEDCTELALTELKSTFALQEALNGWRLVQLREDSLAWEYTRGTPNYPIQVRMNWTQSSLQVSSVLIESDQAALSTLRPASQLIQPRFSAPLPQAMSHLLGQFDALVQLSRELSLIKVQCDVQLLPVVAGPSLPLLLTFFNFDAKIKFDVIIGASFCSNNNSSSSNTNNYKSIQEGLNFSLLSFQNHYGPVTLEMLQSCWSPSTTPFDQSNQSQNSSLRRIVNNISAFLK